MPDEVLMNKAAIIERAVKRVRDEYHSAGANFAHDYTRQDAVILNIQRTCEAVIDMGQYIITKERLGLAQSVRDVFAVLADNQKITPSLASSLQKMIGFRNIAIRDYQKILIPIVEQIVQVHLQELLDYSKAMLMNS